jgi:hypothetical protein
VATNIVFLLEMKKVGLEMEKVGLEMKKVVNIKSYFLGRISKHNKI